MGPEAKSIPDSLNAFVAFLLAFCPAPHFETSGARAASLRASQRHYVESVEVSCADEPLSVGSITPHREFLAPRRGPCYLAAVDESIYHVNEEQKKAEEVKAWVEKVVVQRGLCPWAARAALKNDIKIVIAESDDEDELFEIVEREVAALLEVTPPGLSTTLVGCTGAWVQDFQRFDSFVETAAGFESLDDVALVAFHPSFSRWHELDVKAGDIVSSFYTRREYSPEMLAAIEKAEETGENIELEYVECRSEERAHGHVLETSEESVPVRSVRVQFKDEGDEWVEDVPLSWIERSGGAPLADNLLHRSPLPVVHILNSDVLSEESNKAGDAEISRLQKRNARFVRRAARILSGRN
mmetsp:Transcript_13590/g.25476  ORF Transcript_13590/g.25476 Transcript_13590/m.25476 type:complete len:355 (+) Transcript_13590:3-1067(+)